VTFLDYARRGKNDGWRYAVGLVLGPLIAMILGVVLLVPVTMSNLLPADIETQLTEVKDPFIFFPVTGVIFGLFLAGYGLAIFLLQKKSPLDILGRWTWKSFALGAALWLAYLGICHPRGLRPEPQGLPDFTHPAKP